MAARPHSANGMAEQILDAAEKRVQVLGFNGFSYADVAGELGVTTATIHYYFPGKTDLGVRLIERYSERFFAALAEIESNAGDLCERLRAYTEIYERVLASERLCLCGMLASEYETLAEPMRELLSDFFRRNEEWLSSLLDQGRAAGGFDFEGDTNGTAIAIVGALEGAMLVARAHGGMKSFRAATSLMLMNVFRPPGK